MLQVSSGPMFSSAVGRCGLVAVLLELRRHIVKDPSGYLSGWNGTTDPCLDSWTGVTCCIERNSTCDSWRGQAGGRLRVEALHLGNQSQNGFLDLKLEGMLPSDLAKLEWLSVLDVSNNRLTGPLPFLPVPRNGSDQQIMWYIHTVVVAEDKEKTDIATVPYCPQSFIRYLNRNRFTGSIPDQPRDGLQVLDCSSNKLDGLLPAGLFVPSLRVLNVSFNRFGGPLPSFRMLRNLGALDLSHNAFAGTFPVDLYGGVLTFINVSNNLLEGGFPRSLVGLPFILSISIAHNTFTGNIPAQIVQDLCINAAGESGLDIQAAIFPTLDIRANKLTGPIPSCTNKRVKIYYGQNGALCGAAGLPSCPPPNVTHTDSPTRRSPPVRTLRSPLHAPATSPITVQHGTVGEAAPLSALAIAAIIISTIIVTLIPAGILLKNLARRWRQEQEPIDQHLSQGVPLEQQEGQMPYEALQRATNNFAIDRKIGRGGFGDVYLGVLPNGDQIAVKVLHPMEDYAQAHVAFEAEVAIISQINHRNLVKIVGHCAYDRQRLLVYEFKEQGSLLDRLQGCSPRIIHRDIKPANILLNANFEPAIADFGLAKLVPEDVINISTKMFGTPGYIAPEVESGKVGDKVDIWSFGVVLLELVCGLRSAGHQGLLKQVREALASNEVENVLDRRIRSTVNFAEARSFLLVALGLADDPESRPTMRAVVQHLCGIYPSPILEDVLQTSTSNSGILSSSS
eukprot:SM000176S03158  [mRNA]  locus=s176:284834:291579:- [translate_table: standard]